MRIYYCIAHQRANSRSLLKNTSLVVGAAPGDFAPPKVTHEVIQKAKASLQHGRISSEEQATVEKTAQVIKELYNALTLSTIPTHAHTLHV